jgi:hypothetical protein
MAITRITAQRLCTAPEFELFEASMPASARQLSPARLRQKVTRARRLRDKYRDLAKRQRLEARGKRAPQRSRPAQGQENTERKAQLFQETLERFETQLRRTAGDAAPAAAGAGNGAAGKGAAKGAAKKGAARKGAATDSAAEEGAAKKAAVKKGAVKKGAAKKGAAKKGAAEKGAATKSAARKGKAKKSAKRSPAADAARPAPPGKAGAAAMKGGRSRPAVRGPQDAKQQAQGTVARSHTRASTQRTQSRRDNRGK